MFEFLSVAAVCYLAVEHCDVALLCFLAAFLPFYGKGREKISSVVKTEFIFDYYFNRSSLNLRDQVSIVLKSKDDFKEQQYETVARFNKSDNTKRLQYI